MGTNRRQLNLSQRYALFEALKSNVKEFEAEQMTLVDVAKRLSTELGFEISDRQIGEARDASGITWTSRAISKSPKKYIELKARIESLENALQTLLALFNKKALTQDADITITRGLCHNLYWQLADLKIKPPRGYLLPPDPDVKQSILGK